MNPPAAPPRKRSFDRPDPSRSLGRNDGDRAALALFMRRPELGRVKTRLAATHGDRFALQVYVKLLQRTLGVCRAFLRRHSEAACFIFATPAAAIATLERDFSGPWRFFPQGEGHLGQRMEAAFAACHHLGYPRTILVGTDLVDLEAHDLEAAFHELERAPVVLGPTADGGFYLVGTRPSEHAAFRPQSWGHASVYPRTRDLFRAAGLIVRSLALRHDLDTAQDLPRIERDPLFTSRISVIVPTRRPLEQMLPFAEEVRSGLWPGDEILLVHPARFGPSQPDSAPPLPADDLNRTIRLVPSELGRGRQLNAGARAAVGDLLWFLHDDCRPPAGFAYHLRTIAARPDQALGCFRLAFQPSTPALALIAAWANLRTRWLRRPYGDQGLFCRRQTFDQIGGFQRPMLMEDVDFVARARTLGDLTVIDEPLCTAPTRYLQRGVWWASLSNHLVMLLHILGTDDALLHRLYYRCGRGSGRPFPSVLPN